MAGRRKENDREELKLRVVETASKSFMTLGIKAVHMDDIASSLSISKRTLYELFGDKEELLLEVFRFYRHCMPIQLYVMIVCRPYMILTRNLQIKLLVMILN